LLGGQQDGAPAAGQPRLLQPPQPVYVLAATSGAVVQPGQPSEAWDWLTTASARRALDPASADRNDSLFAGALQGDEVFAWAS
jgi:hypothetical protein